MNNISLAESAIDALAHLIGGNDKRKNSIWPKPSINLFDGFEILDDRICGDDEILYGGVTDIPIWPMDARVGLYKHDGWLFKRVSTLKPQEWRGKLKIVLPRMYDISECWVPASGKSVSSRAAYGATARGLVSAFAHNHSGGGMSVNLYDIYGAHKSESDMHYEHIDVAIAHGIELRREYMWSVMLGQPGIPRARFFTDIPGIRAVFKFRDIPPGRERRAALRHWVREHWRQKRSASADDKAWVRAHLRGAKDFTWNDLSCRVEPSRDDLRRNLEFPTE